jgi:hypothetical protein
MSKNKYSRKNSSFSVSIGGVERTRIKLIEMAKKAKNSFLISINDTGTGSREAQILNK